MKMNKKIMMLAIIAAFMMLAVPIAVSAFSDNSSAEAQTVTDLTAITATEEVAGSATVNYYVGTSGYTLTLKDSATDHVKLYIENGVSVTINAKDGALNEVEMWACTGTAASVTVESTTKDGGFQIDGATAVTVSSAFDGTTGTITWTAVSEGGDNINVLGKLNVTGTYASSLTLYQANAEITAVNFSGTVKCGTTQITVDGFSGILSYSDANKIAISGTVTGTVTGISENVIYSGITYGIMYVHSTVMTCYAAGTDAGVITLATGDKFAIMNGSAVVKHIVSTTLDNEVTFKNFVTASTNYVEITATSDTVTTMKSTAFASGGCTGGSITVDKGKFTLVDGTHSYSPISGSCGCTFNLATIGTKDGWTYVASKLSEMQSSIDSSNCVLAIMGEPAVLTDTLDLTSTLGTIPVSLYVKKATMTSLTIVNATFTHTMAFDNVNAKIWNVHIEKPIIDSMDGPNGSGSKCALVGTVTLKAGSYNVPKDGLIIGYYVSENSESNVTGSLVIDSGATFDITPIQVSEARSTAGPVIVSANGMITNSGIVTIGTTTLSDLTKVEGKVTLGTDNKISADNGSKITWGTKSLTATDGTFEVALATMSPTIKTGTVTMDKADIYTGQTVTVNNGATFIITGAMAIQTGATITNGGTVKVGTYALTDVTEIKGPMTYDGTSTISASSGSKITWGSKYLDATSGSFDVTLTTMSPTVKTGTVTLYKADIYPGQIVTVNSGATLAITDATTIYDGAKLVNNGTVDNSGTLTNNGIIENKGTFNNTGTVKFGSTTLGGLTTVTGAVSLDKDGKIDASASSQIDFGTPYIKANASSAWNAVWDSENSAYDIVLTAGTVEMTATVWQKWTLEVDDGATLIVPSAGLTIEGEVVNNGIIDIDGTLTVNGTLTNNGLITVDGVLRDTFTAPQAAQMIKNEKGTIDIYGTLMTGITSAGAINVNGEINFIATTTTWPTFTVNVGSESNTLIAKTDAMITLTSGTVQIVAKSVGGSVAYTLEEYSEAAIDESGFFKSGDSITIDGELTVVNDLTIPTGVTMTVNGVVVIESAKSIVITGTGAMTVTSDGVIIGGTIDFTDATLGSKVLTVENGGVLTTILDGSDAAVGTQPAKPSKMELKSVVAGANGIIIAKGSVVIDGTYTTDDDGTITITSGTATITGTVDEGVKIVVPAGVTVNIPAGGTLEFDAGSSFENSGTINFESPTSSTIIYEEGSTVNGVEIEVTTKQTEGGVIVAIIITLKTANADKLLLKVDGQYLEVYYVEAFEGDSYADALAGIEVESLKSRVTFDGWYNVLNEKVTSDMTVGAVAPTLTAKFTETPREGVTPHTPSIEPTVITVDETSGYDNTTMLVAAVAMLVVAIFVLGYVVIVKRK